MPVTPIAAHCRRCNGAFHLYELVDARSGVCPRCHRIMSDDWTPTVRENAARADDALHALVHALRRLRTIPSNVIVSPHSVIRNLLEEVGWQREIDADPRRLEGEVGKLDDMVAAWHRRLPDPTVRRQTLWSRMTRPRQRERDEVADDAPSPASSPEPVLAR